MNIIQDPLDFARINPIPTMSCESQKFGWLGFLVNAPQPRISREEGPSVEKLLQSDWSMNMSVWH